MPSRRQINNRFASTLFDIITGGYKTSLSPITTVKTTRKQQTECNINRAQLCILLCIKSQLKRSHLFALDMVDRINKKQVIVYEINITAQSDVCRLLVLELKRLGLLQ